MPSGHRRHRPPGTGGVRRNCPLRRRHWLHHRHGQADDRTGRDVAGRAGKRPNVFRPTSSVSAIPTSRITKPSARAWAMSAAMIREMPLTSTESKSSLRPESDRSEDGELVSGVDAFDIERGIGFGVTQLLGIGEHIIEIAPGVLHDRQDIIAGAIEDAVDPLEGIGGHALAQALHHRYAPGNGCLELQRGCPQLLGRFGQFKPMDARSSPCWRSPATCRSRSNRVQGPAPDHRIHRPARQRYRHPHGSPTQSGSSSHAYPEISTPRSLDRSRALTAVMLMGRRARRASMFGVGLYQADDAGPDGAEAGKRDSKRFSHGAPFRTGHLAEHPATAPEESTAIAATNPQLAEYHPIV